MKTRSIRFGGLTILLGAALFTGCADDGPSDALYYKARPDVDFTAYETFAFVSEENLPDPPEDLPEDIPDDVQTNLEVTQDAVREQMEMLGLTEVDEDEDADLYVVDLAATNDESGVYWECVGDWYWYGWWGWVWDPCAWLVPIEVEYTVGSVMVLLVDPTLEPLEEYGRVPFGGLLQGVADGSGDPEKRIQDGVARLFSHYPADQTGQ